MKATDERCPFRKFERENNLCYKTDEEFQYCLGENCMAFVKMEGYEGVCGLVYKPILHQEVNMV